MTEQSNNMTEQLTENTDSSASIPEYQARVIAECRELSERELKLRSFLIMNPTFGRLPEEEQVLLIRQHEVMKELINILNQRIRLFK